ncbi:RNA polymerase sigma factor, partial [Singulisphaera acidiphila]
MTIPILNQRLPDSDLWRRICQGDAKAFEVLVGRYQSLVSAVAYNVCGNVALSEDVAQETFWAAWRQRASLLQPDRLRPWLCGIARNLGKNACGKAARAAEPATALDLNAVAELTTDEPGPVEDAVSREEESLVWETLAQIPDAYREPL